MQISLIAGKRVFNEDGNELGYALYPMLTQNRARIAYLVCADENEEEFILPARALRSCGDVLVVNAKRTGDCAAAYPCPMGLPVYTDTGTYLGAVCDMLFEKDGTYFVLTGQSERYSVAGARFGNAVILRSQKKSAPVGTEKKTASPSVQKPKEQNSTTLTPPAPPTFASGLDRVNLLGRKVKRTVYAQDGSLLAVAGDRITAATVANARRQNLLLRLTVNTLTEL